jgi:hypothetical protein
VVFALYRCRDLHNVFNNFLHYLLHGIRNVYVTHTVYRNLDVLDVVDRDVIGNLDTLLDKAFDGVRYRMIYEARDFVRHLHFDRCGHGHGGGNWYSSLHHLLDELFHRVGNWLIYETFDWIGNIYWNAHVDCSRHFHDLLDVLLYGIWNLPMSDVLYGNGNLLLHNLFNGNRDLDWHGNGHSSRNGTVPLHNSFHGIRNVSLYELLYGVRYVHIPDPFDRHSYGAIYKFLYWNWDVKSMRNGNFVWLRVGAVDDSIDRIWYRSRYSSLEIYGNCVIYISINRVRDWSSYWNIHRVSRVTSMFDEPVNWNWNL